MRALEIVLNWIISSSKNPANISLFIKGLMGFLVILGIKGIEDQAGFTDAITNFILITGQLISAGIALYGFVRKIRITFFPK